MNNSPAHLFTGDFLKAVKDYRWLVKNFHPYFPHLRLLIA